MPLCFTIKLKIEPRIFGVLHRRTMTSGKGEHGLFVNKAQIAKRLLVSHIHGHNPMGEKVFLKMGNRAASVGLEPTLLPFRGASVQAIR